MHTLFLATNNHHKLQEIQQILAPYNIIVEQASKIEKIEPKEWSLEQVAGYNAELLANKIGKPVIFVEEMRGKILEEPMDIDKDCMPYERIFVPFGFSVPICRLSREEKNKMSHRAEAFQKIGEYVKCSKR